MNTEAEVQTEKTTKSIVPAKYAGRYKGGGNDDLAFFINEQCKGQDGFDYNKFWQLCKDNGLPEDKVDHYAGQVAEKRLGSHGRSRMTLRNMLATIARKDGKLKNLAGELVEVKVEKAAVSGAAAKAQESKAAEQSAEEGAASQF